MDMTGDRRLWVRPADLRRGFEHVVARHAVVGDDDADPKVTKIVAIDRAPLRAPSGMIRHLRTL
jgi:hypothetical protein